MKALDMTKTLQWVAAGILAVAAFGLVGCGKKDEQSAGTGKTPSVQHMVKIGHAAPLTGGIAHLGKDNENGVRLAIEEANGKRLSIGGETVSFEMLSEDDEGKENKGPIIAQKFADAKVA